MIKVFNTYMILLSVTVLIKKFEKISRIFGKKRKKFVYYYFWKIFFYIKEGFFEQTNIYNYY